MQVHNPKAVTMRTMIIATSRAHHDEVDNVDGGGGGEMKGGENWNTSESKGSTTQDLTPALHLIVPRML